MSIKNLRVFQCNSLNLLGVGELIVWPGLICMADDLKDGECRLDK
jgi:hypothetical protein